MNNVVSTSVVLFGIVEENSNNYRKLSKKCLSVLLVKTDKGYKLPSYSSVVMDIDSQSVSAIDSDTGLKDVYVEQLYTFSSVIDDVLYINPTFLGLVSKEKINEELKDGCYWSQFNIIERKDGYDCEIINEIESFKFSVDKKLKKHTSDRYKFIEKDNGKFIKDISIILISAFERLRNKVWYTDIVFNMMGEKFTLKELQQVYEAIENRSLLDAAFRRVIIDKVEETDEYLKGIGCRPSKLFKYKERIL